MQQLLADIAHPFRAAAARRQIEIVWDAQTELPTIATDRVPIQVFLNLLKNALARIGEKGQIT